MQRDLNDVAFDIRSGEAGGSGQCEVFSGCEAFMRLLARSAAR